MLTDNLTVNFYEQYCCVDMFCLANVFILQLFYYCYCTVTYITVFYFSTDSKKLTYLQSDAFNVLHVRLRNL